MTFEGTETLLHVEQVIPAIGQMLDPTGLGHIFDHKPYPEVDEWGRITGSEGLPVGGDARGDRRSVTEAIGDGRRAAIAIDHYLQKRGEPQEISSEPVGYDRLNLNYYERAPRPEAPIIEITERTGFEEIEGGIRRQQVTGEGRRCFSCGNCLLCDNCWTLCPDVAVLKTEEVAADGSHYVFDYDYCKGCGICANECPSAYILMQDEL